MTALRDLSPGDHFVTVEDGKLYVKVSDTSSVCIAPEVGVSVSLPQDYHVIHISSNGVTPAPKPQRPTTMKLQDLKPGSVFETSDGKRYVKADHIDKSGKAKGQWECISLEDGSHPKPFPNVNHEEVTPIGYFDAGPVTTLASADLRKGDIFQVVDVHKSYARLLGERFIYIEATYVSLFTGDTFVVPTDAKIRVFRFAHDPRVTTTASDLADAKDAAKLIKERLQALHGRLDQAFGPIGLTNPDGAEDLLRDTLDEIEGLLKKG